MVEVLVSQAIGLCVLRFHDFNVETFDNFRRFALSVCIASADQLLSIASFTSVVIGLPLLRSGSRVLFIFLAKGLYGGSMGRGERLRLSPVAGSSSGEGSSKEPPLKASKTGNLGCLGFQYRVDLSY